MVLISTIENVIFPNEYDIFKRAQSKDLVETIKLKKKIVEILKQRRSYDDFIVSRGPFIKC